MCLDPGKLVTEKGTIKMVCRKCDQCIKARKRKWIGRLNAEAETSTETWFCTFTYGGGDHERSAELFYIDLRRCFARIRKAGYKFKYISVGEYGEKNSRAHFHAMIFWQGAPPPAQAMGERIQWPFWKHGFTQLEYPRSKQAAAVYIMEYMDKHALHENQLKYSKNPAIGTDYLLKFAEDHATKGAALFQDGDRFWLPNNKRRNGKSFYYLVGTETNLFQKMMHRYLETWVRLRPLERLPSNEMIDEWMSDLVQEVDHLDEHVRDYIAHHYGYKPTADHPYIHTHVLAYPDGFTFTVRRDYTELALSNQKGEKLWLAAVHRNDALKPAELMQQLRHNGGLNGAQGKALNELLAAIREKPLVRQILSNLSQERNRPQVEVARELLRQKRDPRPPPRPLHLPR